MRVILINIMSFFVCLGNILKYLLLILRLVSKFCSNKFRITYFQTRFDKNMFHLGILRTFDNEINSEIFNST